MPSSGAVFAWGHHGVQLRHSVVVKQIPALTLFDPCSFSKPEKIDLGGGRPATAACGAYQIVVATDTGVLYAQNFGGSTPGGRPLLRNIDLMFVCQVSLVLCTFQKT